MVKLRVALCLSIALIVLVAGSASAVTYTFTSTADFDAGVKAPTTGGNLGIETTTDNLGIAAGAFELGNLKGDSFTTADADADTAKWDLVSGVSTGCGTVTRTIAAGVLSISVQSGGVGCRRGVRTAVTATGDWDIRIKVDKVTVTGATNLFELSVMNQALVYCTDGGTVDGLLYQDTLSLAAHALDAFTCVNGAFTAVGSQTGGLADPSWIRLTRATNTFTWSYSADGSVWIQDEQTTNANIANPVYILLNIFSSSLVDGTTAANLDDYHLATGTVSAGGFRTAGTWTSASQTSTITEDEAAVTITYSGASAAGYVDYVALFDGVTQLAIDGTDRTSGTTATSTFALDLPTGWSVQVGLAGDGGASTAMASVVVVTTEIPAPPPPVDPFASLEGMGLILISLIGALLIIMIFVAVISYIMRTMQDPNRPGGRGKL